MLGGTSSGTSKGPNPPKPMIHVWWAEEDSPRSSGNCVFVYHQTLGTAYVAVDSLLCRRQRSAGGWYRCEKIYFSSPCQTSGLHLKTICCITLSLVRVRYHYGICWARFSHFRLQNAKKISEIPSGNLKWVGWLLVVGSIGTSSSRHVLWLALL